MGASIWLPITVTAPRDLPFIPSLGRAPKARRTSGNKSVSHLLVIGSNFQVFNKSRVFLYQACTRCAKNASFAVDLNIFDRTVKIHALHLRFIFSGERLGKCAAGKHQAAKWLEQASIRRYD
ncbi:hypothetical protein [Paraburkholderia caffeinilytica]|jgi:hypothetical protein|uniref:hypothetical protein n=1 Tax=Paraburkholderia caffeinilytica TaxID=1761016 RepID=UPI0013BE99B7|nr:hypothetical protein [Paraburkholderia caffeinilytica]